MFLIGLFSFLIASSCVVIITGLSNVCFAFSYLSSSFFVRTSSRFELLGEGEDSHNNRRRGYDYFLNNDFISKDTLNQVTSIEVKGDDQVMKKPMQWSPVGFSIGGGKLFGKSSRSFGHTGWGGSMAFADPENNLSISYTMNMLTGSMLGDQRALNLVEATYKNL